MAASPSIKIYNSIGEYVASVKYFEDAAILMAAYGIGATVRVGHKRIIWTNADEPMDSLDVAAAVMRENAGNI